MSAEEVQATTDEFFKNVYKMSKLYREDMVVLKAKDMIEEFRMYLPLFAEACNPAMQAHHWAQVRRAAVGGSHVG